MIFFSYYKSLYFFATLPKLVLAGFFQLLLNLLVEYSKDQDYHYFDQYYNNKNQSYNLQNWYCCRFLGLMWLGCYWNSIVDLNLDYCLHLNWLSYYCYNKNKLNMENHLRLNCLGCYYHNTNVLNLDYYLHLNRIVCL